MDQADIAERLADLHGRIDRIRQRNHRLALVVGFIVLSAGTAVLHGALKGVALGVVVGFLVTVPGRFQIRGLTRQLAALQADHPEKVALAMDRYRLARAAERAERWKVFR